MSETFLAGERPKKFIKNVFKYDANGNRTELSNYKGDGKLSSTIRSTFDANGKLIKRRNFIR
jgi:hypothetical protein